MAFFSFTRQHRRRRVIFAALLSAAIACGFLGVSSTQLRAQADSYGGDLILLKDAAHVQMNGNQPAYDETGLPIGLDSTADAPIGNFKVGDWVLYRVNVLNRGNGIVNRFTVTDFIPEGITYQESWVRNCDMLNDFTVAPTDHLWVREGHSFDPNNGASGLEDVTFPCKRANPTMPKSFTHCNGQWNAESDTFGLASYATLYILGRVNKDGAGKTITNTAFITSSFTGATVSVHSLECRYHGIAFSSRRTGRAGYGSFALHSPDDGDSFSYRLGKHYPGNTVDNARAEHIDAYAFNKHEHHSNHHPLDIHDARKA